VPGESGRRSLPVLEAGSECVHLRERHQKFEDMKNYEFRRGSKMVTRVQKQIV
jgi:hypothetical protein